MVPEGSQGVDRVVREVWKTLSVPTGTPRMGLGAIGGPWNERSCRPLGASEHPHAEHPSASGGGR